MSTAEQGALNLLKQYADLEGTEVGEYCQGLVRMAEFNTDHGMTKEFHKALWKEIEWYVLYFKEHARIVVRTETMTVHRQELEWID